MVVAMKILFLSFGLSAKINNGGAVVSKNNLKLLSSLPGIELTVFSLSRGNNNESDSTIIHIPCTKNKIETFFLLFKGYSGYFTPDAEKIIIEHIKSERYDLLFLDGSHYGRLARKIKQKKLAVKIVVFFHNVELKYSFMRIKLQGLQYLFYLPPVYYNETCSMRYADVKIAINDRDKKQLEKIYRKKINGICSTVWFDDEIFLENNPAMNNIPITVPLNILFLGSYFTANVAGIKWFINNVLPLVNVFLIVAGKGMENLKETYKNFPKIKIIGYVNDVDDLYRNADCVVNPVFDGSGMKVKTGEALHYGKTVIGTPEAFTGYNIRHGVEGYICKTTDEFVQSLEIVAATQKYKTNNASLEWARLNLSKDIQLEKLYTLIC
ncbi:MAG: glycosyltransferase family 4 protein [Treponema sp.]|jgi:glycosyltransferase involved in cell wall biosynthesis|nr:glycosyltransferase family 4 protein [Treponema sp.]